MTAYLKLLRRHGQLSSCLHSSTQVSIRSSTPHDGHEAIPRNEASDIQPGDHTIHLHSTVLSTRVRKYLSACRATAEVGSSVTADEIVMMSLSPLDLACLIGNTQAITLLLTLCPEECLDALIHPSPHQDSNKTYGIFTALHLAVLSGRLSAVSRLLRLIYQLQRESVEIQRFKTNKKLPLLSGATSYVYTLPASQRSYTIDTEYSGDEDEDVVSYIDAKALFLSDNNNLSVNTHIVETCSKGHNYDSFGEAVTTSLSDDRKKVTCEYTWSDVMHMMLTGRDSGGMTALELAVYLDRVSIALFTYAH